jgi:hypothetical protein
MLYHHGQGSYEVAVSEAATKARDIMERKITSGQASAAALLEHINTNIPVDAIARGQALMFDNASGGRLEVGFRNQIGSMMKVHKHALGQIAAKAEIPMSYLSDLVTAQDGWKRDLSARILNDHFGKVTVERKEDLSQNRHLVRSVNGEVRGFLSDKYRRLDSRPLLEAFAGACQALGAVPVDGTVTDTRVALKAFLPMVFEPVPNEVMCLGIEWSNSDFGAGKHALRAFIFRLWCANGATMEDALSQVHLGGRLSDNIEFSQRTYMADTRAQTLALGDVVKGTLGPANVAVLLQTIKAADEKRIEWRSVSSLLGKKLLKEELSAARDAFESDDVINLPAQKSIWRASNAVSWIAGKAENADRKLELQRIAGQVIHGKVEAA